MISLAELGLVAEKDGNVYFQQKLIKIAPKERAVLHILISHWPAAVPKSSFSEKIWKGAMSDESLVRCIAKARESLSAIRHVKIAALYGVGYQLQIATEELQSFSSVVVHHQLMRTANAKPQVAESIMHARQLIHQRTTCSLQRAEALLRKVMRETPVYDPARLAFAECISTQVSCGWALRQNNIQEALKILEDIPVAARMGSGYYSAKAHLLDCAWAFDEAVKYHERAFEFESLDASAHYYYGWHLLATNKISKAIAVLSDAYELAPFSPALAILLVRALVFSGELDRGLIIVERIVKDHPHSPMAYVFLLAYNAFMSPSEALADELLKLEKHDLTWSFAPSSVVCALARCGKKAQARSLLDAHAHDNPALRATFSSGMILLGEVDQALESLAAAADLGCGFLPILLRAPENRDLANHPAFQRICEKVFKRL
ncbi:winged helix-turn-helix domain-containing protein [Pseudomonas entomophila]|uniref:tetratricopeptide repeat protein n=1 Tax=Pseudomonas entomophila TaxID=312306 RepID=UPI0023D813F6|nr:winged helix-turn-helix domain-containing protein [Pseudomonas entomophila]MDF0733627.1 winged helix-turn-helix domain-containing protein [Pseudomonas entomophila]